MKIFCTALLFVAVSAAAADPVDSQSGTGTGAAPSAPTGDYARGSASSQRSDAPAPQSDDASDDSGASSSSGLNYETGQLCVTRGAGGICLESSDD
jgi:hypothetical protein